MKENWDDLRYFLAVHRQKLPVRAASELGVSYMTVLRRLDTLEKRLGVPLFNRASSGYELTRDGEELLPIAERTEVSMRVIAERLGLDDLESSGLVRVACGDVIGLSLIGRYLPEFEKLNPAIRVEITVSQYPTDIEKRQAHLYLRPIQAQSIEAPQLNRCEITHVEFAFFAADSYLARAGKPDSLDELGRYHILNVDESGFFVNVLEWINTAVPPEAFVMRSFSYAAVIRACEMGLGIAVLPFFVGRDLPGLVHLFPAPKEMRTTMWALALPDVASLARVKALTAFLGEKVRQDAALFVPSQAGESSG